mmetsp:Transcript_94585/g.210248  ORF Transcript_94585/g.210248 Transcript_94585/m.210248 type:complete len:316 (+) Transcript_94585:389-1336(+)
MPSWSKRDSRSSPGKYCLAEAVTHGLAARVTMATRAMLLAPLNTFRMRRAWSFNASWKGESLVSTLVPSSSPLPVHGMTTFMMNHVGRRVSSQSNITTELLASSKRKRVSLGLGFVLRESLFSNRSSSLCSSCKKQSITFSGAGVDRHLLVFRIGDSTASSSSRDFAAKRATCAIAASRCAMDCGPIEVPLRARGLGVPMVAAASHNSTSPTEDDSFDECRVSPSLEHMLAVGSLVPRVHWPSLEQALIVDSRSVSLHLTSMCNCLRSLSMFVGSERNAFLALPSLLGFLIGKNISTAYSSMTRSILSSLTSFVD